MVLDRKSSQEYSVNAGVPQGFILGTTLFILYINDRPDDVTLLSMLMILLPTLLKELELASELESDLQDTVDWGRMWFVNFNARKT